MYSYLPIILVLVALIAMVYFLMIRPLRQREKEHDRMVLGLEIGDSVITAGGMYGKVERVDDDSVILEVESGARVRITKGGILKRE